MTVPEPASPSSGSYVIFRHHLVVRLTHWINVLCLSLLLMSGLQIFNAHPMLHWGQKGADADMSFLRIHFPSFLTIPSYQDLATGRRWHFFFAWLFVVNGLVYLIYSFMTRHIQRDVVPTRTDLAGIGASIVEHLKLHRPRGPDAERYNVLQRITYLLVLLILLPAMLLSGLTMSPGVNAALPLLLDLFGGRQSARSIHFICASLLVAFVLVHVFEVFAAGVVNEMRSMITGRYRVLAKKASGEQGGD